LAGVFGDALLDLESTELAPDVDSVSEKMELLPPGGFKTLLKQNKGNHPVSSQGNNIYNANDKSEKKPHFSQFNNC